MRLIGRVVIILVLLLSTSLLSNWQKPDHFESDMFAILEKNHVPGSVIGIVNADKILYLQGFGFADLDANRQMNAETSVFRAASLSKLITATAAMQLVDQNQISLHEDIAPYLKPFTIPSRHKKPVHLLHLLTHTAGFDRYNTDPRVLNADEVFSLEASLEKYLLPSVTPPGEVFLYSNHGMALAGLLIEKIKGLSFEEAIQQSLFSPLSMTQSSFQKDFFSEEILVQGYRRSDGKFEVVPFEYTQTVPSSMLMTTAADMCQYLYMLLNGGVYQGTRILSEHLVDSMLTQQMTNHPAFPGIGLGFFEYEYKGHRYFGHGGSISGFHSQVDIFPDQKVALFMAFNSMRGGQRARKEIESLFFETLSFKSVSFSDSVNPLTDDSIPISCFSGIYHFGRHVSQTTAQKWNTFRSGQMLVKVLDSESLLIRGNRYVRKSPEYFVNNDSINGWRAIGFKQKADGSVGYLVADGGDTFVRLSWRDDARLNRWIIRIIVIALLFGMFFIFPVYRQRKSWVLLWAASGLFTLICLIGIHTLSGPDQSGFSAMYRTILIFPFLGQFCLFISIIQMVRFRFKINFKNRIKTGIILIGIAQGLFLFFLNHWNLLGWHFF